MRVVAAMSGGVDSAVAAARMLDAGHEVVGVHLALSRSAATLRESARGCCTIEDAGDARRAADVIGIPFYVWDLSDRFHEDVVEDFMDAISAPVVANLKRIDKRKLMKEVGSNETEDVEQRLVAIEAKMERLIELSLSDAGPLAA